MLINFKIEVFEPDREAGFHLSFVQHRQHKIVMLEHFVLAQVRDVEAIVAWGVLVAATTPLDRLVHVLSLCGSGWRWHAERLDKLVVQDAVKKLH